MNKSEILTQTMFVPSLCLLKILPSNVEWTKFTLKFELFMIIRYVNWSVIFPNVNNVKLPQLNLIF